MKQLSKLVLLLLIAGFTASAQDGKKMTFQGSLFQADQPFNGTAKLEFTINIDSANNWTETITEVNVINGLYSVVLGETNPLPSDLFYMSSERTLMIKVDDVELGDVVLYSPFATASPYELPDVIDVDTLYAYALSIGTDSTDNVYLDSNGDGYFVGDLLVEGEINSASELNTALNDTTGVHFNADGNGILTGNLDVGSLTMNGEPFIPEVRLPLDMAGPNGNRSVMLSSEGENGNDGTFRLADSLGRSRVTLFANKFNSDSLGNRTYTGAGGAWFGGANGSMGANISSDGSENSNGFLELGDKSGIPQARLSINESAEGVTSGALSLRGSDGSEMNLSSRGMNLNRLDMFDSLDRLGLTLTRRAAGGGLLHFPSVTDDFTYNWIQNRVLEDGSAQGSAQVANIASDGSYVTGTGMSGGFFYIDSWANDQFYTNVELGLTQDDTKLPYMHLRGSEPINWSDDQGTPSDSTDDTSGSYLPNLVSLETKRNEDGVEKGRINLTGTAGFSHNMEDWIDEIRNDDGSGTYSQQRNSVFRVKNDNDQFSAVFLNRFDDGQTRLQLASHDEGGANQGIVFVGANAEGGYSYIGSADPTNTLRAGMYVGDNLPHLFMQGTFDVQGDINADSLGNLTDTTYYRPEYVNLDVHHNDDGDEYGALTLRGSDGSEFYVSSHGIEGMNTRSKKFELENDEDDRLVGDMTSNSNGGQLNIGGIIDTSDTTTSYGGGFSAGTKFWEGNPQLGYIHLRGTVNESNYFDANMKFAMEAVADGDQERAEFKMFGNDLDGNNAAKTVLWMNSTMDQNGQSAAEIRSEGSSSPNFTLGAKTWEDNGANMPFLRMNGDMEVPGDTIDTVATFYHPDLVWLEVQKWENGTELGSFMLRGTDGSEFGINSHGFTGKVNDIDASHLNADTHLQVGDFFGSDGRKGLYVSQDGYIDAAGASLRGNLYVQASRITETDNAGNEFYPNIAGLEVHQWGDDPNTGEVEPDIDVAHLSLKSSDGSESNMNAYGLTSGNNNMNLNVNSKELALDVQGAQYANIGIGIDDGSPNSNNGGTLNLGGASQTSGIRAYGEFIDGEGTSLSHMALDDNSGSYVYLWGSGSVDASGSVNAPSINQTSDARFKKDVNAIEGALAKVQKLNGYTYFWNRTAKKVKGINDESEQIGVIAQELEEIFPQLVNTDANGYKSVNYASMTAVLIEAVKELNAKVENLETENTDLKAQVESSAKLESRLAQIEKLLGVKTNETSSANNK